MFESVTFSIARGEFAAITGESGMGKSTLLNLVAGLERADGGTIVVDGVDLSTLSDDELTLLRRRRMGFVFQSFHVLPYLSVAQNVGLPLALLGERGDGADARTLEMLRSVGLDAREGSRPRELSGGELQRVAIARALVHRPAIVLADEPTGNLDADNAAAIIALLRECARTNGATVLLATHSRTAAAAADRVLALSKDGVTVESALTGR
ncbi:MAG TPA: ABC transporter ATP-binding protein [Casimicrobiaceae bacterium]|nr:ABC transporter ATP-binding protein [Casimicrobiaceae bacterium]